MKGLAIVLLGLLPAFILSLAMDGGWFTPGIFLVATWSYLVGLVDGARS